MEERRWRGCCEEPPNSRPGLHLQTDVSNNSPSARRAKTAGGLAEAEVKVNYFTAVLPPQPTGPGPSPSRHLSCLNPRTPSQENGFHVGRSGPCTLSPSCTSDFWNEHWPGSPEPGSMLLPFPGGPLGKSVLLPGSQFPHLKDTHLACELWGT